VRSGEATSSEATSTTDGESALASSVVG
jgi:hypothetical protein